MSKSRNKPIGITLGDPAGIGAEVTAKALAQASLRKRARFQIIGDECVFKKYFPARYSDCAFIDLKKITPQKFKPGTPGPLTGQTSLAYLNHAITLLKNKELAGLVTAPVCKEAIVSSLPGFHGHTEFLAEAFNCPQVGMMFVAPRMRLLIASRHIPLNEVSGAVNSAMVYHAIALTDAALKNFFHLKRPLIGVCGLNPHAGEGGTIGMEEIDHIIPAIKQAKASGINVEGPLPADTIFYPDNAKRFAAIIAMYHDQGLAPIKALYFTKLVNLTVGLPFVRTSPAHGTAFDIAGKNKADASSMIEAIKLAVELA